VDEKLEKQDCVQEGTTVEVDRRTQVGRKTRRGFTISSGRAFQSRGREAALKSAVKRSNSLPSKSCEGAEKTISFNNRHLTD